MPRSPANNTLAPLLRQLAGKLGDRQAASELRWMAAHVRKTLGDTAARTEHSGAQYRRARLWRDQPAPSTEEADLDARRFSSVQWAWLRQAVADRVEKHKPLQYILGSQPFGKTEIGVRSPVLIPRPETEEWVLRLAESLAAHHAARPPPPPGAPSPPLSILDACTGSGCVALGLASELPPGAARIAGVDVSADALALALSNQTRNAAVLNNEVEFHQIDLLAADTASRLEALRPGGWDMIVANPPYVTPAEYRGLDADVRDWEDVRALVPMPLRVADELDPSGVSFIERLAVLARALRLAREGALASPALPRLVVEIGGAKQTEPARQAMHDNGFGRTEVWKDMAGTDRAVLGYAEK
ncbi:hypothetical protein H4R21_004691 [Coemansia helicoidea]|uniref:Uncharacterized protein n=1 Tax=Coemansia helicoidea TaxID=1286919 RepID=A0ACC1KXM1_9FUNG|nr:hypothetical protein H4R21_004691 [Coemansia helicoidea]